MLTQLTEREEAILRSPEHWDRETVALVRRIAEIQAALRAARAAVFSS